jgi:hypothetical protein
MTRTMSALQAEVVGLINEVALMRACHEMFGGGGMLSGSACPSEMCAPQPMQIPEMFLSGDRMTPMACSPSASSSICPAPVGPPPGPAAGRGLTHMPVTPNLTPGVTMPSMPMTPSAHQRLLATTVGDGSDAAIPGSGRTPGQPVPPAELSDDAPASKRTKID